MIQSTFTVTAHEQCDGPNTSTSRDPPDHEKTCPDGFKSSGDEGHGGGAARCVIETLRPPMLTVPDRSAPSFGVSATVTVPFPATRDGLTVIQSRSSLTAHEQSDRPFAVTG